MAAISAISANQIGKVSVTPKVSAKICWIDESEPNSAARISVCTKVETRITRCEQTSRSALHSEARLQGAALLDQQGFRLAQAKPEQATRPNSTKARKSCRQPKASMITLPTAGATAGTSVKTIIAKLTTRAISRPANRSRTIAIETMRGAATPRPCTRRASSSISSVGAAQAAAAPRHRAPLRR